MLMWPAFSQYRDVKESKFSCFSNFTSAMFSLYPLQLNQWCEKASLPPFLTFFHQVGKCHTYNYIYRNNESTVPCKTGSRYMLTLRCKRFPVESWRLTADQKKTPQECSSWWVQRRASFLLWLGKKLSCSRIGTDLGKLGGWQIKMMSQSSTVLTEVDLEIYCCKSRSKTTKAILLLCALVHRCMAGALHRIVELEELNSSSSLTHCL